MNSIELKVVFTLDSKERALKIARAIQLIVDGGKGDTTLESQLQEHCMVSSYEVRNREDGRNLS